MSDRDEIQALCALGAGDVYLEAGRKYVVDRAGTNAWCVNVPGGCRLHLNGATIRLADDQPGSVSVLNVAGSGTQVIGPGTIDGNRLAQYADEHRHGLFVRDGTGVELRHLDVHGCTGDAIYLYSGLTDVTVHRCIGRDCDRNGITMGGSMDGVSISGCTFSGNASQQVDSEPGPPNIVSRVTLSDCTITAAPNSYALTVSGDGSAYLGHDWTIDRNVITGGIFVIWVKKVVFFGNTISAVDTKPGITVNRHCEDVTIANNAISISGDAINKAGVFLMATGPGNQAMRCEIFGNSFTATSPTAWGIRADGIDTAMIKDNRFAGAGPSTVGYYSAVRVRTTAPVSRLEMHDNEISAWGDAGLFVFGAPPMTVGLVDVQRNSISDVKIGFGFSGVDGVPQRLCEFDNKFSNVATPVSGVPAACEIVAMKDVP